MELDLHHRWWQSVIKIHVALTGHRVNSGSGGGVAIPLLFGHHHWGGYEAHQPGRFCFDGLQCRARFWKKRLARCCCCCCCCLGKTRILEAFLKVWVVHWQRWGKAYVIGMFGILGCLELLTVGFFIVICWRARRFPGWSTLFDHYLVVHGTSSSGWKLEPCYPRCLSAKW